MGSNADVQIRVGLEHATENCGPNVEETIQELSGPTGEIRVTPSPDTYNEDVKLALDMIGMNSNQFVIEFDASGENFPPPAESLTYQPPEGDDLPTSFAMKFNPGSGGTYSIECTECTSSVDSLTLTNAPGYITINLDTSEGNLCENGKVEGENAYFSNEATTHDIKLTNDDDNTEKTYSVRVLCNAADSDLSLSGSGTALPSTGVYTLGSGEFIRANDDATLSYKSIQFVLEQISSGATSNQNLLLEEEGSTGLLDGNDLGVLNIDKSAAL